MAPRFTTFFATFATMIGVSIGLGNVWRFPYMMGKYGGSAFLFAYLIFTLLIGIPALMSEWSLGRITRKGPIGTFKRIFGNSVGKLIGIVLVITVIIADSYYLVVISNVAFTSIFSFWKGFYGTNIDLYHTYLSMGSLQYFLAIILLVFSLIVIEQGLNKGIIPISQVFVPFFILVMAYMIIHVLLMEGTTQYLLAFIKPDLSKLNAEVLFAAMGQSIFSLGLGGTFMLVYGSYLRKEQNIPKGALWIGLGDMGAALMASLFIVPALLYFHMDMESGPQLLFDVLPKLFTKIPLGGLLGGLFLLGLTFVAFLSNIAALEVIVASAQELGLGSSSKTKILIGLGLIEALIMIPSAFRPEMIEILDLVFGSGMQTLGSLFALVGLTWGLGYIQMKMQIADKYPILGSRNFFIWLKYIVPLALVSILIWYLIS